MSNTPTLQRADDGTTVAWIRSLSDKAVKLTDHKPQVFEVGPQGILHTADANTFKSFSQFTEISGLKPGLWRIQHMNEADDSGAVVHWQFHWASPESLDLDNLPTDESLPPSALAPLTAWERIDGLSVETGKISLFDADMVQAFVAHTGDERLVVSVCQDPFADGMVYEGVLPGGFFSCVHNGGYTISGRRHDGAIVQLRVRESRKEEPDESD